MVLDRRLVRIYNRLDRSFGDGDGVLSSEDTRAWTLLAQSGLVAPEQQTLGFTGFKDKVGFQT